jgi:hypothetical protein
MEGRNLQSEPVLLVAILLDPAGQQHSQKAAAS